MSGLVYVILLLGSIFAGPWYFSLFFGFLLTLSIYEFCKLTEQNFAIPTLIGLTLWLGLSFIHFEIPEYLLFAGLAIHLVFSSWMVFFLFTKKELSISYGMKKLLCYTYVIMPFIWMGNLNWVTGEYNYTWILWIFVLIWINDTFAYLVGVSVGKRKLFERISPKKTREGFFGGMISTCIIGFLISLSSDFSIAFWLPFCVFISIFGTLGDLIESKLKRLANVKDSGRIMPGHGGILDRLDSAIFIMPFVLPLIYLIN